MQSFTSTSVSPRNLGQRKLSKARSCSPLASCIHACLIIFALLYFSQNVSSSSIPLSRYEYSISVTPIQHDNSNLQPPQYRLRLLPYPYHGNSTCKPPQYRFRLLPYPYHGNSTFKTPPFWPPLSEHWIPIPHSNFSIRLPSRQRENSVMTSLGQYNFSWRTRKKDKTELLLTHRGDLRTEGPYEGCATSKCPPCKPNTNESSILNTVESQGETLEKFLIENTAEIQGETLKKFQIKNSIEIQGETLQKFPIDIFLNVVNNTSLSSTFKGKTQITNSPYLSSYPINSPFFRFNAFYSFVTAQTTNIENLLKMDIRSNGKKLTISKAQYSSHILVRNKGKMTSDRSEESFFTQNVPQQINKFLFSQTYVSSVNLDLL